MDFASDPAGWMWVIAGIGVLCLGAAIIYGITMNRNRASSAEIERVRDGVTDKHYKEPEGQKP